MTVKPGILTVVSTPIGNLGDLSQRAAEALQSRSKKLLEKQLTVYLATRIKVRRKLLGAVTAIRIQSQKEEGKN